MRRPAFTQLAARARRLCYWRQQHAPAAPIVAVVARVEPCDPLTQSYLDALRYGQGCAMRLYARLSDGTARALTDAELTRWRGGDPLF